jgi:uncharacterized protein YegL
MYTQQSINQRIVKSHLTRPRWINRSCRQHAILCRDGSPSMSGQKAKEASQACFQLVREFSSPVNKGGFWTSVIDFSGSAEVKHDSVPAVDLVQNLRPISIPLFSGGTNITAGLKLADQLSQKTPTNSDVDVFWLRPVVVLFSDGCHNTGPKPGPAAEVLRRNADIVTVAYGSDADIELLRELATSSQHHYLCKNGNDLRQFFAAVGTTMTASLASGVDATDALAHIQHLTSGRRKQ